MLNTCCRKKLKFREKIWKKLVDSFQYGEQKYSETANTNQNFRCSVDCFFCFRYSSSRSVYGWIAFFCAWFLLFCRFHTANAPFVSFSERYLHFFKFLFPHHFVNCLNIFIELANVYLRWMVHINFIQFSNYTFISIY